MMSSRIAILIFFVHKSGERILPFRTQESLMSSPVGVHRTLGGGEVDFDILILTHRFAIFLCSLYDSLVRQLTILAIGVYHDKSGSVILQNDDADFVSQNTWQRKD